jgi:hypothetical protein
MCGSVTNKGKINSYNFSVTKPEEKTRFWEIEYRWEDK